MTCSSPLLSQSRRQSLREGGLNLTPRCMPLTMTNSSICRKIKMRIAAAGATSSGTLVDVRLSKTRDMAAARAFFRSAKSVTGITPARVTTDGHDSYPRAIDTELGGHVRHRTNRYLNNRIEQDHRGIKGRYQPMRGFKSGRSAARFCRSYDQLRNFPAAHQTATNLFPPMTADCTSSPAPSRCSAFCRPHEGSAPSRTSNYTCWREH